MIAVDTNVLVYAHRRDAPFHHPAKARVTALAEGRAPWAIPWPCVHEFLAVVTHPRVYDPPSTLAQATGQLDAWLGSPTLVLLPESTDHWQVLAGELERARAVGPMVHDARVAAICLANGVEELWTLDRDFARHPALRVRNLLG